MISPVAAIGIWQLLSSTGVLPPSNLVSPAAVARTAYTLIATNSPTYGTLQGSLLVSAERWGIGFGLGTVIAVLLAVCTGLSRIAEAALDPTLMALRSIPLLGVLPLFIVWFGIGELPKDLIVLLGALFPMYVNAFSAVPEVPGDRDAAGCAPAPLASTASRSSPVLIALPPGSGLFFALCSGSLG